MNHEDLSEGRLECIVGDPRKENEGTKNAYISYLVHTQVCLTSSTLQLVAS